MTASTPTSTADAKVWFITGCSTGFGREFALAALRRGDQVIATARKIEALDELKALGCQVLTLDVTSDDDTVKSVVKTAHGFYGRIDILVNNAGVGLVGAVEETSSEVVQRAFDVNVFGLLRVTRAVLPYMREQQSGTIANIGSVAGVVASPACGIYSATKYAVAGVTQSLRAEVASFGIKVTVVEPGMFETALADKFLPIEGPVAAYEPIVSAILGGTKTLPKGDATKGAQAVVDALTNSGRAADRELPCRLPLGAIYEAWQYGITTSQKELADWKDYTNPETFA
ncbi:hypothetical protein Poli38472_007519 [Pythium oligandrum]|uniref:Uncharacterized protein n=1 Tax=Pythium oligandrum TaxID=41045 RepID=A0A8K1FQD9_PYTOL|nr:hypothetical protein Poli38472_007519 [Pythium oligandrum]|eukprot:TMW67847.1 hypothetical protein Poli38472_007519 [Pythium oligandrum]